MSIRKNHVIIAYTSRLFSHGLERIIDGFEKFTVVGSFPVGDKLNPTLVNHGTPDFLIIEIDIPGKGDLEYIRLLTQMHTSVRILLISHLSNRQITGELLESGILGYILKSCSSEDVLSALKKMLENTPYFCSHITKTLLSSSGSNQNPDEQILTVRELEVLSLLVQSYTNKYIADNLQISENTVKTHRRNIQKKFGVSNLLGLVRFACREQLIDFGCEEFCTTCPHIN